MKRIFFFALASLALASCSQDEEFVAGNQKVSSNRASNGALSFSTYTAAGTRATEVTAETITGTVTTPGTGFMVSAVYKGAMYISEDKAIFGTGYNGGTQGVGDEVFDTQDNTYYWPINISTTDNMTFYAYNVLNGTAPKTAASFVDAADADKAEQVKYKIAGTATDQQDLVVAKATATAIPTDGVQPLNFTHALSKVNFSFDGVDKNQKYTYVVKKIEVITTAGAGAVCSIKESTATADNNDQADIVTWAFGDNDNVPSTGAIVAKNAEDLTKPTIAKGALYDYSLTADQTYNGGADKNAAATKLTNNFMFYPTTDRVLVRVYYKVVDGYDAADPDKGTVVADCGYGNMGYKTLLLQGDNVPAWKAGYSYRYTLTLPISSFIEDKDNDGIPDDLKGTADADGDADDNESEFSNATPIRFSVSVSAWETESNSTIAIQ